MRKLPKKQITFRIEDDTLKRLKNIEKYHSKITDIIDIGIECYENNITMDKLLKFSMNKYIEIKDYTISEKEKKFIKVIFKNDKGELFQSKYINDFTTIAEMKAFNPYDSTIVKGWEELDMRDDSFKLNFYLNTDKLVIGNKKFKVIDRNIKVDYPLSMELILEEIIENNSI